MKKKIFLLVVLFGILTAAHALGAWDDDIREHKHCKTCGMSREMFAYSRVLVEYNNGTVAGTCSIRCAAVDLILNMGRVPESIKVADFNSRKLIEADKAIWLIGGAKEGTMSSRGKWAFGSKSEAEAFMAKNGGALGTFYDALKASFEDLYKDLRTFWDGMKKQAD